MANALAEESSPYLRQHAENPVAWLPWGPAAFEQARARDAPLFVSIGYSSCHWCHVMERESFEDERTAELLNESFVCVKVDREERPDVDALYMEAVQGMTGHGGWPLNVFLTPEGVPFYGGTYFPPRERPGMPSFAQVALAVSEAWGEHSAEIRQSGERIRERLVGGATLEPSSEPLDPGALNAAVERLAESFDAVHGGFGGAPKFPQAPVLGFLMCRSEANRENDPKSFPVLEPLQASAAGQRAAGMALYTLRSMAGGGIHDQVGGGFHRYAVDASWTVPHFEKMLYDNALLARAYLRGHELSGDEALLEVCHSTLDWALREMLGPEGGFYSALDADSDGVEGSFYVWTVGELHDALGADADAAVAWLGASEAGNFSDPHHPQAGLNVLEDRGPRPDAATRARIRSSLLEARSARTRPGLDDKRLTSWNALMISALADAGGERYLDAAARCAEFLERELRAPDGRLLRTYSSGTDNGGADSAGAAKIDAFLEDYAFFAEALIALFEATCEERWLTRACVVADELIERFSDPRSGGFFATAAGGEALIARRKELEDSPIPAGGSSAALGLLRLAQLTGEERYERESTGAVRLLQEIAPRHPTAFGHMLQAMHWHTAPMRPIACALPPRPAAVKPRTGG